MSVIGGVAGSSKQGRKAAWKFVKDNWEELYNRYQGGFLISRLIKVRKREKETSKKERKKIVNHQPPAQIKTFLLLDIKADMLIISVLMCSFFQGSQTLSL